MRLERVAAAAMMCLAAAGCGERRSASSPALAIDRKGRPTDHPIAVAMVDKTLGWGS